MEIPWAGCADGAGRGQTGVAVAMRATARTTVSAFIPDNPFIVPTCEIMSLTAAGGVHGADDHAEASGAIQGSGESFVGALRRAAGARAPALSGARRRPVREQLLFGAVGHPLHRDRGGQRAVRRAEEVLPVPARRRAAPPGD